MEIWLSGCAQLAEMEKLLESPSENMPSSARLFGLWRESLPTTESHPQIIQDIGAGTSGYH